jgi:hypothetical protein
MRTVVAAAAAVCLLVAAERAASACGCFAVQRPDPTVPLVQAGERILFAVDGGMVTAHIQIQYSGAASEFGWLLPLPSLPTLRVGTDELFARLIAGTQPRYSVVQRFEGDCTSGGFGISFGGGSSAASPDARPADARGGSSPVVSQDVAGPYDYAILRADDKSEVLDWLAANQYFVPAGTDAVMAPYVREGAYFLALKLRPDRAVGDLQPVIVEYASDLPMIPIVLTSVAAQADMGIQVWMLGPGRAIPRNYFHTVLNDAAIDWLGGADNYNQLVIDATREAEGRHTFVTEYASTSSILLGVLDAPLRFGERSELAASPSLTAFMDYLRNHGFAVILPQSPPTYPGVLTAILNHYVDDFQPELMADEIWERVVEPARAAGALFRRHTYLTRLYTTLSPEQMDRDPVFSYNRSLPEVSNQHTAVLTIHCGLFGASPPSSAPATLVTEQGYVIEYPDGAILGNPSPPLPSMPSSSRIETVAEEGAPRTVVDNRARIAGALDGCAVGGGAPGHLVGEGALALLLGFLRGARTRPRFPVASRAKPRGMR